MRKLLFNSGLLLWLLLYIGVGFPLEVQAQQTNGEINLEVSNEPLPQVLRRLERTTTYKFMFTNDDLKEFRITKSVKAKNISEALNTLIGDLPLTYNIQNNYIYVLKKKQPRNTARNDNNTVVQGLVVDEQGEAMPGVSILVKGTTVGVTTDIEGHFSLKMPQNNSTLVFSFIGMKNKELTLKKGQTTCKVVLEEEAQALNDVVVTGYFQRKKVSQTGSEVVVTGDELKRVGSLNLLQAISSFDPGVRNIESTEFGSDPNRMPEITVRGEKGFDLRDEADDSRTNPNAPLYIMDGIEVSATTVYDMDMNRVSSFSILKDAAATSLYGSRGANGVILITTKRPEPGEIRVTANVTYNISAPDLTSYNLMNAREKLEYERLAGLYTQPYGNREEQTLLDIRYNNILAEVERGVDTYWLSQPLQTAVNQRYSLYLEGGDKHFRYGLNLRYDDDGGVMKGSGRDRMGINVYFSYEIANKLVARNDLMIDDVKATNSPYGSFSTYASMNPYERIYDRDGEMIREYSSNGSVKRNPLVDASLPNRDYEKYTQIRDNFQVQWWPTQHLMFRGNIALTKQINRNETYLSPESVSFDGVTNSAEKGRYTIENGTDINLEANITANYNQSFFDKLAVSLGLGSELITEKSEMEGFTATGFLNDNLIYPSYALQYLSGSVPSGTFDKAKSIGFFGNLNLNWDNRYILDFTYRTDGSSRFGRDSRFAPFWAVGAAWNLNNEKWWDWTGYMKLRASVGSTGSTNFSADQAITRYIYSSDNEYNGIYGAVINAYGNPALKWQNVLKYNVGLDMNVWKNIITLNLDAYLERTENLLLNIDVAPSSGFTYYTENMGSMDNMGVEARLRLNLFNSYKHDFNWSMTLSMAHERNKIRKISNAMRTMNEEALKLENSESTSGVYRMYEVGRSQTALMVVRSAGIDPATGNEIYIKRDGSLTFDYDPNDKVQVGDTTPTIQGYINNNIDWKGFNLYFSFNYECGAKQFNSTLANKVEGANPYSNADSRVLYDRWKEPGDIAMFRRIDDTSTVYQSSRLVQRNNFINMTSLSLSYDMPQSFLKSSCIERCKFTFSMTDLFRISTIKQERGTNYPFARTFSLGLNLTI